MRKIPHRLVESTDYDMGMMDVVFKVDGQTYHQHISFTTEEAPMFLILRQLVEAKHYIIKTLDTMKELKK
jgi:hypothetical protein